ncbi:lamin-A-like isoform X2 [Photinus pyralis]|uniref:lamin-A-like isoform X2 n=1 Tax=Photinus pyralis TaxID=7054 RepID=UPI001266FE58|nr:lamin-A-like isoform X2 [Photinus pyralis]
MVNLELPYVQYFASEMNKVQSHINQANKIAYETLEELENRRKQILQYDPNYNNSEENLEYDLSDLELEMEYIQNKHDKALSELEMEKQALKKRLSHIEKLDLLINALTHKIFNIEYHYQQQVKELSSQRENVLNSTEISRDEREALMDEVDKKIKDLEDAHAEELTSLEGQRSSLQKQCAMKTQQMDVIMDSLRVQHRGVLQELEESKMTASPSQLKEVDRRIDQLNKMFEKDVEILNELQLAELLESRGLCFTQSNKFLTSSGSHLTRSEATRLGLLEGINLSLLDQEEYVTDIQPTTSELTVSESEKMDTEDVVYLKTIFGKPLTLALAEITAQQPRDPIHYLGHWLFKYRYNQEVSVTRKDELQELIQERERLESEKLRTIYENEAHEAVLNLIIRAEEGAILRELERIARDAMVSSEDELAAEAKDVLGVYNGPTTGE